MNVAQKAGGKWKVFVHVVQKGEKWGKKRVFRGSGGFWMGLRCVLWNRTEAQAQAVLVYIVLYRYFI